MRQKSRLFWIPLVLLLLLAGCGTAGTGNGSTTASTATITPTATTATTGTSNGSAATPPAGLDDQPKTAASKDPVGSIINITASKQAGFDRLVVELSTPGAGYDVRYADDIYTEGRGDPMPLVGAAKLEIIVRAPAYDQNGHPTYQARSGQSLPNVNITNFNTFQDAKWAGSFEGQSTIGLGIRAQLPFTVSKLSNPDRIVIDVYMKISALAPVGKRTSA